MGRTAGITRTWRGSYGGACTARRRSGKPPIPTRLSRSARLFFATGRGRRSDGILLRRLLGGNELRRPSAVPCEPGARTRHPGEREVFLGTGPRSARLGAVDRKLLDQVSSGPAGSRRRSERRPAYLLVDDGTVRARYGSPTPGDGPQAERAASGGNPAQAPLAGDRLPVRDRGSGEEADGYHSSTPGCHVRARRPSHLL